MFETIAHSSLGMFVTAAHPSLGLYRSFFPSAIIINFVILNYINSTEISSHIYTSELDGVKPNIFSDKPWISTHFMDF